ncbi:hypothetical protein PhCBS80983_g05331 [Powellomyces hirtus]|uniref:Indoleamine 2,3-dioxygenase n=1 Tax=Powellomyces hirtus TaxID=109895 RepID=A0A507DVD2_9FUNG|nr:hypothetical protein PhCBS80983_g05331 [Powellomyces hirtus]
MPPSKASSKQCPLALSSVLTCPRSLKATPPAAAIPRLQDYNVDPLHGFLPVNPPPLRRLPEIPYAPWEHTLDDLSALLLAGTLRETVEKLPHLSTDSLKTEREWQRAYLVLSFIGQAYVWGYNQDVAEVLPIAIAKPWHSTAQHLGLKPVITYAAVELYNYRLIDPDGPFDLSNLAVMHTFTGNDEAWFYLISIATEAAGAPALAAIVAAMHAVKEENLQVLIDNLNIVKQAIEEITKVMMRMYERNDPHIFYHRVRPYLAGWEGSSELPDGLFYEGVAPAPSTCVTIKSPAEYTPANGIKGVFSRRLQNDHDNGDGHPLHGTYRKYAGASAGQSSLIHCLDVALGIEHNPHRMARCAAAQQHIPIDPTAKTRPVDPKQPPVNHIHEMRKYMPGCHRAFITAIEHAPSIRKYINNLNATHHDPTTPTDMDNAPVHDSALADEATRVFNECVLEMRTFRDRHLQIVATYIVLQAKKKKEVGHFDRPPASQSVRVRQSLQARGTGGTDLIPFLKQSRDETTEALLHMEI